MSGQKRRWQDWPDSAWEPGPPKVARLSPEPGPSWRTDPCAILTDLEKLCNQKPQQLLPFLLEHDYQLEQLGESPGLSPARVYTLLRALKLAMESAGEPEQVQQVLALVLRPAFVLRSLLGFIAELESFQHQDGQISQEVMEDTVAALHHLLTASPKQTKTLLCYPVDLLFATVQRLQSRGFEFTWIIQKRLHDTKSLVDATFPRSSVPLASPAWREDFHTIPVFPTPEEIFVDPGQKLKRNLPVGKFASDAAYLDTHFRLLREDFIRPLRAGISAHFSLRNVFGGAGKQRGALRVYRNVQLVKVGTSPAGAMYMARFQAPQGSAHASSKRLLSGSLTCLISRDCGQVLFGTVVGGNRPELLKGAVWLAIKANHSDLLRQHLGKTSFIMVESPAFFESYRHVLEGLQEMDPAQVPFQSYVVQCRTPVAPPAHFGDAVTFDLSVLRPTGRADKETRGDTAEGHVTAVDLTAVRPCDSYIWSPETFPHLDESQILAIRMALSREFVLIQGPPGTGKTFIGLQIVEILLRNQSQWWGDQRPFLVVCYTNHALDQFMEGILRFQPSGVVRIGGRSRSDKVAVCSLRNLRQNQLPGLLGAVEKHQYGWMRKTLQKQKESIAYRTAVLELLRRGILTDTELAAEIRDDNLARSWGCFDMCDWLKIDPGAAQERKPAPAEGRGRRAGAEEEPWPRHRDERALDDEDDLDPSEWRRSTAEEKFAYILPPRRSLLRKALSPHCPAPAPRPRALLGTAPRPALKGRQRCRGLWCRPWEWQLRLLSLLCTLHPPASPSDPPRQGTAGWPCQEPAAIGRGVGAAVTPAAAGALLSGLGFAQSRGRSPPSPPRAALSLPSLSLSSSRDGLRKRLEEGDIMTDEDVANVRDVGELRLTDRWRLYRRWMLAYERELKETLVAKLEEYEKKAAQLAEFTFQEDLRVLKRSRVIGMTTTGAAKYRKLLQKIQPHTVIVEEAAEILEAHVLTCLTPACKHLILIGDHQQLRPKPADYTLEKKYFLGISLFERMINNQIPYVQLLYQHRMRPEISRLLVPLFYKQLKDHNAVAEYEKIKGVESSVFFIQHTAAESHSADSESYRNEFEASFLVSLSRYLLDQGYDQSQVTVLTPYHGQVLKIRTLMRRRDMGEVAVHAVDDFQGEENDIILLSLVRSNREGRIGFLQDKNRLCVALSRARKGFYCIGNLAGIAAGSNSKLWKDILRLLKRNKLTGEGLTLVCQNHPDTKTVVKESSDFSKIPDGGCTLQCQTRLECGHPCVRCCHPHDRDHGLYVCQFPCSKLCELNHRCPRKCKEPCEPCSVEVEKVIPKCGHLQTVPCHMPADHWLCQEPCKQLLECKHPCTRRCGEACSTCRCKEMIDVTLPCSHVMRTECYKQKMPPICLETCKQKLECGHHCKGNCYECVQGRLHVHCRNKCTRVLLCSHQCQESCFENCPPCKRKCSNKCRHSRCDKPCGEICFPCIQPCSWKCRHYRCTQLCSERCNRPRCNEPCQKSLSCSHPCAGLCGEPCPPKCRTCHRDELTEIFFGAEDEPDARFVVLEDCGHVLEVQGLDRWMDGEPDNSQTQHVQLKVCPRCATPIQHNTRYNNVIKAIQQKIEAIKLKIQGNREELEVGKQQLLLRLNSDRDLVAWAGMERSIMNTVSRQSLLDLENTLNFFASLSRLKQQAQKCTVARERNLKRKIEAVERWLIRNRHAFTAQQLRECRNEITRISYLGNIFERLSGYENKQASLSTEAVALANEAIGVLQRQDPFTQSREESLQRVLEKIEEWLPATGLQLSEAERVMITEAMQFGRGHWYRCPQGHLYTIGECGRPMQQSSCPECGATIGGQNHALTRDNVADDQILEPARAQEREPRLQDSILALPNSSDQPWSPTCCPPSPHPQPDSPPPPLPSPHLQPDSPPLQTPSPHPQPDSPPPPLPSPHLQPDSQPLQTPSPHLQPDSPPPPLPSPRPQPDSPPPRPPSPHPQTYSPPPPLPSPHLQPDSLPLQTPSPHPQPDSPPPRPPSPGPQPDSPPPRPPSPGPQPDSLPPRPPSPGPQPDSPPPRPPSPGPQPDSPPPRLVAEPLNRVWTLLGLPPH
ncbi:NFX1-type zinc finger-containing protein 1 [Chelonia mydas]|uniref:NFX1-type zinc finger-containing protein 1 n=1 Tax=Chelonia mydas TaxID=8469 RepID=UPI001CA919DD|nr:NFX1-type zinc finger-containing protein 1 [Chelonia mydas]